jgi:hypothetical protein
VTGDEARDRHADNGIRTQAEARKLLITHRARPKSCRIRRIARQILRAAKFTKP